MRDKYFIVTFTNGKTVFVRCHNSLEAEILAKAEMIKNGFTFYVWNVRETKDGSERKTVDMVA